MDALLRSCARQDIADLADSFYNFIDDGRVVELSDSQDVSWNIEDGMNAKITLAGNRSLSISNPEAGCCFTLKVTQDQVGSRTLALPSNSKVVGGGLGVIPWSSNPGSIDLISGYFDGTTYFWSYGLNFT